jgi:hypothetical protein
MIAVIFIFMVDFNRVRGRKWTDRAHPGGLNHSITKTLIERAGLLLRIVKKI